MKQIARRRFYLRRSHAVRDEHRQRDRPGQILRQGDDVESCQWAMPVIGRSRIHRAGLQIVIETAAVEDRHLTLTG